MELKVIKKGAERSREWKDTAVYFESRDKAGNEVYCMYERAANLLLTVGKKTIRNESPFSTVAESFFIRRDGAIVGSKEKGAYVENEEQLYKGKKKLTREEFAKHYNNVRLALINRTTYLEP